MARARVRPEDLRVETNADGQFELSGIQLGEYRLELAHQDYNPAVGEFTVMPPGSFVTSMRPLGGGSDELMTGIIGLVRDRNTGSLLSGVHVTMGGGRQGVLSDLRGEFVLDRLIGGQHVVEFSMIGYTPRADTIRVVPGRVTTVEVSLSVDPVQLDPIEVSVERREIILQNRGFYHRQKTGFGKFIDREEIEMRGPSEMTDLFSGMAGVELYSDPFNQLEKWVVLRSGRHMTLQPRTLEADDPGPQAPTDIYERCFPRVYIDGTIAHRGGDEPARLGHFRGSGRGGGSRSVCFGQWSSTRVPGARHLLRDHPYLDETLSGSRGAVNRAAFVSLAATLAASPVFAQTAEQNDSSARAARRANSLPLIPARTLDFTTDEGSWISLDLSPDGETIVFELLGDLYTLPVGGGTATRITSGQGYDMQPRYSPDGAELVFVSDRDGSENLWVANADGTGPRQLTDTRRDSYMSPLWTPDGEYVIANKGSQLWLYHEDGGSGVQLTGHRAEGGPLPPSHIGAAFGSDPRYLWVNVRGNLGGGFPAGSGSGVETDPIEFGPDHSARSSARRIGDYQIALLDRETGRTFVRTHEHEGAFRPMPSPDGRWLAYATRYDARPALRLRDLASGEETWLVMDVQRDDSQGGGMRDRDVYPGSAWTPDSRALITSYGGGIMRVEVPSGDAAEIPFTARVQQELGPLVKFDYPIDDSTLTVSQIRGARPSPDGRRLVFTALDRLWIGTLPEPAGTQTEGYPHIRDARRLTSSTDVEHGPAWSPGGRHIAYVTWNDSTGGDIWRVRADGGGEPEKLTPTSAFFDRVAYSGDGTRILAVRGSKMHRMRTLEDFGSHGPAAELEYVWLPAEGGEPTRIAWVGRGATQQGRNAPHPGPDPGRIYVWAGSEGLLSMRYDGTDIRTVVKVTAPSRGGPGAGGAPDEVVLSPGRQARHRAGEPQRVHDHGAAGGRPCAHRVGRLLLLHAHPPAHADRRRFRGLEPGRLGRILFHRAQLLPARCGAERLPGDRFGGRGARQAASRSGESGYGRRGSRRLRRCHRGRGGERGRRRGRSGLRGGPL